MAASEDQPQPVVLYALVVRRSDSTNIGLELLRDRPLGSIKPRAPPQRVDGFESTRRNEPCARVGRHPLHWPMLERGPKRIV
jgi:hypothetical protein